MFRRFLGAALLLTVLAANATPVNGQDKKKKPDAPPPTDADTLTAGSYAGKLKTTPDTDGSFVVSIPYQHYVLKNPNKIPKNTNPQMTRLLRDQQNIANIQAKLAGAEGQAASPVPDAAAKRHQQVPARPDGRPTQSRPKPLQRRHRHEGLHLPRQRKPEGPLRQPAGSVRREGQRQEVHGRRVEGTERQGRRRQAARLRGVG